MKLIKLTLHFDNITPVYININHIGHIMVHNKHLLLEKPDEVYTNVGVTTHNNGGFRVNETPEEIIKMCNKIENKRNGGNAYTFHHQRQRHK